MCLVHWVQSSKSNGSTNCTTPIRIKWLWVSLKKSKWAIIIALNACFEWMLKFQNLDIRYSNNFRDANSAKRIRILFSYSNIRLQRYDSLSQKIIKNIQQHSTKWWNVLSQSYQYPSINRTHTWLLINLSYWTVFVFTLCGKRAW